MGLRVEESSVVACASSFLEDETNSWQGEVIEEEIEFDSLRAHFAGRPLNFRNGTVLGCSD
jgi:hypothetical protein